MNFQGAFEGGLAAAISLSDGLIDKPYMRVWHGLADNENRWTATSDRRFPMIALRAKPPMTDDNGITQSCTIQCLVGTNADDDQDHDKLAQYQAAIQETLASIYADWRNGATGVFITAFTDYLSNTFEEINTLITIGGYEHGETLAPFEESGANYEGKEFIIHYSRSDYST